METSSQYSARYRIIYKSLVASTNNSSHGRFSSHDRQEIIHHFITIL